MKWAYFWVPNLPEFGQEFENIYFSNLRFPDSLYTRHKITRFTPCFGSKRVKQNLGDLGQEFENIYFSNLEMVN